MTAAVKPVTPIGGRVLQKDSQVSALQAGIEGVPVNVESVFFMGKHYRIADKVGLMPLLKFAHSAASGLTEDSMEGMVAMYAMIRDAIHPDDWEKFERHAIDSRAEGEDLMAVVETVLEAVTARPTTLPSGSSPPDAPSSRKSKAVSSRAGLVPAEAEGLRPVAELLLSTN